MSPQLPLQHIAMQTDIGKGKIIGTMAHLLTQLTRLLHTQMAPMAPIMNARCPFLRESTKIITMVAIIPIILEMALATRLMAAKRMECLIFLKAIPATEPLALELESSQRELVRPLMLQTITDRVGIIDRDPHLPRMILIRVILIWE